MAEKKDVDEKPAKKGKPRKVGFIKMQVIPNLKPGTINEKVITNISRKSTLLTGNSTSYTDLCNLVDKHQVQVILKEKIGEILPWVPIAIANAKRMFLDIHHNIKPEYLQGYLNEFCYKFNRRYFGEALFDRLLIACATYKNQFRYV